MINASSRVIESLRFGQALSITVLNTDGATVRMNFGTDVPRDTDAIKTGGDATKEIAVVLNYTFD